MNRDDPYFYFEKLIKTVSVNVSKSETAHLISTLHAGMYKHCKYFQDEQPEPAKRDDMESLFRITHVRKLKAALRRWVTEPWFHKIMTNDVSKKRTISIETAIIIIEICEASNNVDRLFNLKFRLREQLETKFGIVVPETTKPDSQKNSRRISSSSWDI